MSAATPTRRVFVIAHHGRADAARLATDTVAWLRALGHQAWMTAEDAAVLGSTSCGADHAPAEADVVVCLGGDGTMLRAVQLLGGAPVPILGVNMGVLGYLAEVEPDHAHEAIERFLDPAQRAAWTVERRMLLDVTVSSADGMAVEHHLALNEGVLEKLEPGHTVRLAVEIDGAVFTSYAADGLIVATPTGSTAYSLSARGPVVSPRHRAVLVTPVSPHMLFDRTLVLDPDERVDVEVGGHRPVVLTVDGRQIRTLGPGDRVSFTASTSAALFVRFGKSRFHQVLKAKFGLADR